MKPRLHPRRNYRDSKLKGAYATAHTVRKLYGQDYYRKHGKKMSAIRWERYRNKKSPA